MKLVDGNAPSVPLIVLALQFLLIIHRVTENKFLLPCHRIDYLGGVRHWLSALHAFQSLRGYRGQSTQAIGKNHDAGSCPLHLRPLLENGHLSIWLGSQYGVSRGEATWAASNDGDVNLVHHRGKPASISI